MLAAGGFVFTRDCGSVSLDVCVGNTVGGSAKYYSALQGGPFVVCYPPPLPVTPNAYDVFVALDGQNFGDTGKREGTA